MKKVILTVLILVLCMNLFAASVPANYPIKKLHTEISKLLEMPKFPLENAVTMAKVKFTLTTEGEIVVLSVETENNFVDSYVKNRLNYKKVSFKTTEPGKVFTVRLKILRR